MSRLDAFAAANARSVAIVDAARERVQYAPSPSEFDEYTNSIAAEASTPSSSRATPEVFKPRAVSLHELLSKVYPPREYVMSPILPTQGLAMVYALRGIGKTHVSLGIAYAVASGGTFLRWSAPQPRGVLFLDGEMSAVVLQERLAGIVQHSEREATAPIYIVTPDEQPYGRMPDLATIDGQDAIDKLVGDDISLIVIDNLSTLARTGKENEGESWLSVQEWALRWRSRGKSVLFIHHAGKGGQQRGTSRREDVLDTVISLRRPAQYNPEDGAVFEVHLEKARGVVGKDAQPFEARLGTAEHAGSDPWSTRTLEDSTFERVVELHREGLNQTEIGLELGIHKSRVSRHLKRARAEGLILSDTLPGGAS